MSLINDALKRAKQAQSATPGQGTVMPPFRTGEPAPGRPGSSRLGLMAVLAILSVIGVCLGWQWLQPGARTESVQAVRVASGSPPPAVEKPASTPTAPVAMPAPAQSPVPSKEPAPAQPAPRVESPAKPEPPAPAPVAQAPVQTPAPAQPAPPEPAPPTPKLQAIFYRPDRPAAIIGGQTVFVGERVAGWRVLAIDRSSATLVAASHTNVLSLGSP